MREAMFYQKQENNKVRCSLCPHVCQIKNGERGKCGVRENRGGSLYSLVFGKAIAAGVDPIEKKPLFHFLPGSYSFSVATVGCNLACDFCQNWQISQSPKPDNPIIGEDLPPETIVEQAQKYGCQSISYTYTEPTIFFEYAYETARLARDKGIKNIFISNGFINPEPINTIAPHLDAVNIDLKGFSEQYYRDVCGAKFQPVIEAIKSYYEQGVFIEITSLIVPGHNDTEDMLTSIADFIASIDKNIPWHISRFHPSHRMSHLNPTDTDTIYKAIEIGKNKGLKYIYSGNLPYDDHEHTYCPYCGKAVITRGGMTTSEINLDGDKCHFCGQKINLIDNNNN